MDIWLLSLPSSSSITTCRLFRFFARFDDGPLTRDLTRSAMVSGISWGITTAGKASSSGTVVGTFLGGRVIVEAESEGGASGAALIDPAGSFFLGFGRGFLVTTSGSARISPLDVDAIGMSTMIAVFVGGSDCCWFAAPGDCKSSKTYDGWYGPMEGDGRQKKRTNLLSKRGIPRLQSPQRGRPESSQDTGLTRGQVKVKSRHVIDRLLNLTSLPVSRLPSFVW